MDDRSRQPALRTADVARRLGRSVQHVRDLERDGVLPRAERGPSGYRRHTEAHVRWGQAYGALATAVGPVEAKALVLVARTEPVEHLAARLDEVHARLSAERAAVRLAREAAAGIVGEPLRAVRPSDAMGIAELAEAVGVHTSALRHWEREGLLVAGRTAGNVRTYAPAAVRDARIVAELRRAGYGIPRLRGVMRALRERVPGDPRGDVERHLADRVQGLDARSVALLRATAALALALAGDGRS